MLNGHKIVSLCISRLNEIEHCRFISELNSGLKSKNAALFIYNINADLYWDDKNIKAETAVFGLIDFSITDLVIIMHEKIKNKSITEKIITEAKKNNVPVMVVDAEYDGCINICFDYKKGFEAVVRHVIEYHSIRKPHFMAGYKNNIYSEERKKVFRQIVEENDITFSEDMVSYGDFWAQPAREAAEKIIESGNIPEAVICANDIMAINVSSVFQEHGFLIPDDVIITGFDGVDEINLCLPRLTSSYCGSAGVVPKIIECIDMLAENHDCTGTFLVEPELIINDSCGCHTNPAVAAASYIRSFNDRFYRYQDDNITLTSISENMLSAIDSIDCACKMFNDVIKDITVIINKDCINCTQNYYVGNNRMDFVDDMYVFFESDVNVFKQRNFDRKDIVPDINKYLGYGSPIIFNVISFMNVPLGYICFHMPKYDVVDYCKIPHIANAIGSGIGGYVNMKYQHYLTSRIERMYKYDSLTGLYNRLSFNNEFEKRKKSLENEKVPITVILVDLDGLKAINDNYGHGAGDNAIHTIAAALKESSPSDAICVRFGGDEMLAVIMGECVPEKIRSDFNQKLINYNEKEGKPYIISASMGIYHTDSTKNTDFEYLVREADAKMYAEKLAKRRKNR